MQGLWGKMIVRIFIYCCIFALLPSLVALELGSTVALELGSNFRRACTIACGTRRGLLIGATSASLIHLSAPAAKAEEAASQVTALVTLDLSIARGPSSPLRIELFGDVAPESVIFFSSLASGTVNAKCAENADEECQDYQDIGVGLKGSQLWRLVPDKRIDFGRVDKMFASRIPPTFLAERSGGLKASSRGAVSVKRGGGAFEFTVTPAYNPALEKEDLVVIGRVAEGDMGFLDEINSIPTRRDIVSIGDVPPLGKNFARACEYAKPDPSCAQFKPLKRIIVTEVSITPKR